MVNEIRLENVEYLNYFCSTITNDERCTCEIIPGIALAKVAFRKKEPLFTSKSDFNLKEKLINSYMWSIALYRAENWTPRKVDQTYLDRFEMWCWRRME
jgi:hypothetical protein